MDGFVDEIERCEKTREKGEKLVFEVEKERIRVERKTVQRMERFEERCQVSETK